MRPQGWPAAPLKTRQDGLLPNAPTVQLTAQMHREAAAQLLSCPAATAAGLLQLRSCTASKAAAASVQIPHPAGPTTRSTSWLAIIPAGASTVASRRFLSANCFPNRRFVAFSGSSRPAGFPGRFPEEVASRRQFEITNRNLRTHMENTIKCIGRARSAGEGVVLCILLISAQKRAPS